MNKCYLNSDYILYIIILKNEWTKVSQQIEITVMREMKDMTEISTLCLGVVFLSFLGVWEDYTAPPSYKR